MRNARGAGVAGLREDGIEPEHLRGDVDEDTEGRHHADAQTLGHAGHAAVGCEGVGLAKGRLFGRAVGVGERVATHVGHFTRRIGDDLARGQDVEAPDLGQRPRGRSRVGDELGRHTETTTWANGLASVVEVHVVHSIWVVVAPARTHQHQLRSSSFPL